MTPPNASPPRPFRWTRFLLVVAAAAVITAGATALLVNIFERKQEARNPFYRVVELTESTEDPAVWGKTFPSNTTPTVAPRISSAPLRWQRGDAAHAVTG